MPTEAEATKPFTKFYPRRIAPDAAPPRNGSSPTTNARRKRSGKTTPDAVHPMVLEHAPPNDVEVCGPIVSNLSSFKVLEITPRFGIASPTLKLKPVRAKRVEDPADYRFSSCGR